ncbi:ArsR family transcriptional regulator [Candidatus Woesearchaeota archaeon]|jgi:predicted transcriptional regulator|nr:ArsR family transcriptional regulator [Candidatus Woesearchaeota archaeon]MBT5739530.1 ArsR family transcriptional regulator [Candidatus Woesearchaeota archaeon]
MTKITIIKVRKKVSPDINQELQWLGDSLGLFSQRDRDSSCFRVFITLVRKARYNEPLSSDAIAEYLHLSRGTVVHHLTKLIESGLVIRDRGGYILRESTLEAVITDMRRDMEALFDEMDSVAKAIDHKLS